MITLNKIVSINKPLRLFIVIAFLIFSIFLLYLWIPDTTHFHFAIPVSHMASDEQVDTPVPPTHPAPPTPVTTITLTEKPTPKVEPPEPWPRK